MDHARIQFLVEQYRNGVASEEELAALRALLLDERYRHLLADWLDDQWDELDHGILSDMPEKISGRS